MAGYDVSAFGSEAEYHFPQYIEEVKIKREVLPTVEKLQSLLSVPRLAAIIKSAKSMGELSSPVRVGVKAEEAKIFKEMYRLPSRLLELESLLVSEMPSYEEEAQERLTKELYGEREVLPDPFGEQKKARKDVIGKVVDISFKKSAENSLKNFKKKEKSDSLQPIDILEFFSAKMLARDSGWDDMLTEIRNIEKEYYKDCLTIPKVIEKKMRSGRKMEREEAEDMLNMLHEYAKKRSISFASSPVIKIQIRLLEMEMDL